MISMSWPHLRVRIGTVALVVLALVIVGLAAIQVYLLSRHGVDSGHGPELPGARSYALLADTLIEEGRYALGKENPLLRARLPLYPVLVVIAKLLAADRWAYLLITIQSAIGFLCGLLIYRIARRLTSSAWIPSLVVFSYAVQASLQWEHLALRETVLYELIILTFFYFATEQPITRRNILFMTLACIAAYYTRATGVFLIVALVFFLAFSPAASASQRAKRLGWSLGALILAAAPWQAYQSYGQGKLALASTSVGGLNLFKGNSFLFEQLSPYVDHDLGDAVASALQEQNPAGGGRAHAETVGDDYLKELALADIRSDYARFFRKAMLKIVVYLSPVETPFGGARLEQKNGQLTLAEFRGSFVSAYGNWLQFARQMSFFVLLFAIPLGLLGMLRHTLLLTWRRPVAIASLGFLLANIAAHALITAESRYRVYLDPLLLLWAGLAVGCIFADVRFRMRAHAESTTLEEH
jgi:hypothetical protein